MIKCEIGTGTGPEPGAGEVRVEGLEKKTRKESIKGGGHMIIWFFLIFGWFCKCDASINQTPQQQSRLFPLQLSIFHGRICVRSQTIHWSIACCLLFFSICKSVNVNINKKKVSAMPNLIESKRPIKIWINGRSTGGGREGKLPG